MATGWVELLRWIRRRAIDDQRDLAATWSRFTKLAAESQHAEVLQRVTKSGLLLPERERYNLVVSIARILAPIEWPTAAEQVRPALVAALDSLVRETDPDAHDSFFAFEVEALEANGQETQVLRLTHILFFGVRDFMRRPCRRDDLPTVALLCNSAYSMAISEYRRAHKPIEQAKQRFRNAMVAYSEAANALNLAIGTVLFEGIHAPIEEGF